MGEPHSSFRHGMSFHPLNRNTVNSYRHKTSHDKRKNGGWTRRAFWLEWEVPGVRNLPLSASSRRAGLLTVVRGNGGRRCG